MSEIQLDKWLPERQRRAVIKGMLLRSYDPVEDLDLLDQDILEVDLPTGQTIDVGWFPENRPDGKFRIVVYRGHRTAILKNPIEANSPFEVASVIQELAQEYENCASILLASAANDADYDYRPPSAHMVEQTIAVG